MTIQSPMEELLDLDRKILELEQRIKVARFERRFARLALVLIPLSIMGLYVPTVLTWREYNMAPIMWPSVIVILIGIVWIALYYFSDFGPAIVFENPDQLTLELVVCQERKRLRAASLSLAYEERRAIYKNDVLRELDRFRKSMSRYRRIHNFLQALIIIGSLATTTVSGMLIDTSLLGLAAVGSSFTVGVAAGFTGYYKFRERSFYLQQTADSIEQEWNAVDLGIGRYSGLPQEKALVAFTEEVERLKSEQQKREQNLDQPSEDSEITTRS